MCDFDAKMQNFSGEGAQPLPQWGGDTPSHTPPSRHLDLNSSHSEILPMLLVISVAFNCFTVFISTLPGTEVLSQKMKTFQETTLKKLQVSKVASIV